MARFGILLAVSLLLGALAGSPVGAQYMFLDANGDGVNTAADRLDDEGATDVDIWLVTNAGRDGAPAGCPQDPGAALSIFSYTVVLSALGGTVEWGPMRNRLPIGPEDSPVNFVESAADTLGDTEYHNGWGGRTILAPGRYRLATLPVRVRSGEPSIVIAPWLSSRVYSVTGFGTSCPGREGIHTYQLGSDWTDADGIGPVVAEAGGPYHGTEGRPVALRGSGSASPHGGPLTYEWEFGDGATGTGADPLHPYSVWGEYTATLRVSDGVTTSTDRAIVRIVAEGQLAPVAMPGGPYAGTNTRPVQFDGSASFDPNDDPLRFDWDFGDGESSTAMSPLHLYRASGDYPVTLTVSDGVWVARARTVAVISQAVSRAPVAEPGGPYSGYVGRGLRFDGSGSSDPDGDALTYRWDFGDGRFGFGVQGYHAYEAPGDYDVRLTVSDPVGAASALTAASVAAWIPARAFTIGSNGVFDPETPSATLAVQVEPLGDVFVAGDADFDGITLRSEGTGGVAEITALGPLSYAGEDSDGNGIPEVAAVFHREDLARLFDRVEETRLVEVTVRVPLAKGGGTASAEAHLEVHPPRPALVAQLRPNPFNPEGTIQFETAVAGRVRAEVFDVAGRLVRVLLDEAAAAPRKYALHVGGGDALASGIYFYRIATAEGKLRGRFAVAR